MVLEMGYWAEPALWQPIVIDAYALALALEQSRGVIGGHEAVMRAFRRRG